MIAIFTAIAMCKIREMRRKMKREVKGMKIKFNKTRLNKVERSNFKPYLPALETA